MSGTEDISTVNPSITISPNPVTDDATISFNTFVPGTYRLILFDAAGRIVQQQNLQINDNHTEKMHLTGLLPGVYTVIIVGEHNRPNCQGQLVKGGN